MQRGEASTPSKQKHVGLTKMAPDLMSQVLLPLYTSLIMRLRPRDLVSSRALLRPTPTALSLSLFCVYSSGILSVKLPRNYALRLNAVVFLFEPPKKRRKQVSKVHLLSSRHTYVIKIDGGVSSKWPVSGGSAQQRHSCQSCTQSTA